MRRFSVRSLRSFFLNAHADRGQERYRRASLTASTSILSQALGILINLVSVPLTVRYLGQERYGVWLTISSLVTWMALTDFGLTGTALVNLISEAYGTDNRTLAREYTSSTFWTLISITAALGALSWLFFDRIPWQAVFRTSSATSAGELRSACALAILLFLLMLPQNMLGSLYNAYQDGIISNWWTIGANLSALVSLVVVTRFRGGLPALVLALSGTRVIVGCVNWYYLFFVRYPWLLPRLSSIKWSHIRRLVSLSSKYMVSQISGLAIGQSQPLLITQILGPAYVPIFVVTYRIITIPQNLVFIATTPLISAYGEARARGDWKWIKGALKKSTLLALVGGGLPILILGVAARPIIRWWAGAGVAPETTLILWLSLYTLLLAADHPFVQMLWGLERVNALMGGLALSAIVTIRLTLDFGRRWGLTGIAAALVVGCLIYCAIQLFEFRHIARRFKSAASDPQPVQPTLILSA